MHMRHNVNGPIFCTKKEQIDFEENKYSTTKMGVAGLMFEPHPLNSENLNNFKDVQMILKQFFDISTGFRFSKMQ